MTTTSSPDSQQKVARWWLSITGKAEGPFDENYLVDGLKSNTIPASSQACPVGGSEWKPVGQWPAFAEAVPPPPLEENNDSPLTNPQLPTMANWICIYAIVGSPLLWVLEHLSCVTSGLAFHEDSRFVGFEILLHLANFAVSSIASIAMVIGGIQLRRLRSLGPKIIMATMLAYFVFGLLKVMVWISLFAGSSEIDLAETTPASEVIDFFVAFVLLAALVFEVVAFVWLFQNAKRLPLNT